jgi:asparagine synthase (glutamine-hydrolysing)
MPPAQAQVWPYWQPPDLACKQGALDDESLLDELEALLQESVCDQMVADVPVGILLSGGVDSSLVTAMAVRASSHVQTFSIGFPGHGKEDETEHEINWGQIPIFF